MNRRTDGRTDERTMAIALPPVRTKVVGNYSQPPLIANLDVHCICACLYVYVCVCVCVYVHV